jgi:hypothetical protein
MKLIPLDTCVKQVVVPELKQTPCPVGAWGFGGTASCTLNLCT